MILQIPQQDYRSLKIGQIWDLNILKFENKIKEVLNRAQAEYIIEKLLTEIKEHWSNYELGLYKYQNKCKCIRGWDELYELCEEDAQNLESLKLSPFFKMFEEEILLWAGKVQFIRLVFELWCDVQRKYIYLESIFMGPSDIKNQLPQEFQRFQSIDSQFLQLMKQVVNKPKVLETIGIKDLQKSLEHLMTSLEKIQKSLTEYLERQRQQFARFYFLGDGDLLEMIGNAKSVPTTIKHLPKIYAGICSLQYNETEVKGMISKESEEVGFFDPVVIGKPSFKLSFLFKFISHFKSL